MSARNISLIAAALLTASAPAHASVGTRAADAMPAATSQHMGEGFDCVDRIRVDPTTHQPVLDSAGNKIACKAGKAAKVAENSAATGGGGGLGVSTGLLAGLAGVLGVVGIVVAVQNRSN